MNNIEMKQHQLMMREVAQNALKGSSVVIIRARIDDGFPIVFVSENVSRYGYSAEDIMRNQTPSAQFVYSGDKERLNQEFRAYLKARVSEYVREYRLVTTTNEHRWIEERLMIEWDEESGRATHCQGIQIDITERKKTEQQLAESLETMRVHAARLDALNQLTGQLISASNERDVFRILKRQLNTVIEAGRMSVALPSSDHKLLEIFVLDDEAGAVKTKQTYLIADTTLGRAFTEGTSLFTPDHAKSDDPHIVKLLYDGWHTSVVMPLTFGDHSLGTLNILSKTPNSYSDDDVQFLRQIAVPVAAKLANQKLVAETKLIQRVVNKGSSVIFQWAPEEGFPVTFVTDNVRQFGYTPDDFMSGKVSFLSIVHPDEAIEQDDHVEFWENLDDDEYMTQYRIISPTGETFWIEDRTTVVRDEDGTLLHLQGFILDITPDKLLEERLRLANTVIENSPAILLRWYATEGYPIDFVTENIDQFGYSAEQLASNELSYAEIIHPDDLEEQTQEIARLIDVGMNEFTLIYRIITKCGEMRWVEDRTTVERNKNGEITHLQGMILDITERIQAEETLKLMQYSIDSAADMIFWTRRDGHFDYVNEAAYRTLGYESQAELMSKSIFDIVPDYSPEQWKSRWEEIKAKGVLNFEAHFKLSPAQNGERFPIEMLSNYHKVGDREYLFSFCRDITERREAAEALETSEKQLRLMLNNLPNAVCMARLDGSLFYVNQAYSDMFGIRNQAYSDMFGIRHEPLPMIDARKLYKNEADRDVLIHLLNRDGFVRGWETEFLRPDGSPFESSVSAQLFPYLGETVILASIFDLRERVEAEKMLKRARDVAEATNEKSKRSEAMVRSVLDQIPIFTALSRFDGSIIYINHAGDAMFGGLNGERANSTKSFYKNPEDRERLLLQLLQDGAVPEMLCDMMYTDGGEFHAKVSSRLIEYDGEEVLLTCIFDLTKQIEYEETLKRARDAAEAANEAKSDFLASMSHELRTPLNGILGYTQLLQRDPALAPKYKDDIYTIHESGQHLLMLINDILDISKIEARKLELQEGIIHTHSFLQGVVNIIRMKAMEKHLEFNIEFAADLPPGFIADAMRVRQILFNLLGNAIKFTVHGEVAFHVHVVGEESDNPRIRFIVEDSGVGIEPQKLKVIFDPFVQAGDKMSRIAGTGLGLAISQRLAEKMNGKISVSSVVGEGSRFCLELQLRATDDVQLHPAQVPIMDTINRYIDVPKTILIVDDNPLNRAVLRDLLTVHRFTIVEAENGQHALDLSRTMSPDLIITDLIMPDVNGYKLVQYIRSGKSDWHADVPVIAMSASVSADMYAETLELGCNEFFSKPVQIDKLLDCISDLLQLEWIESEIAQAIESSDLDRNMSTKSDILFPDDHNLGVLMEMVEIGDMMGVIDCTSRLAADNPKLFVFAQYVQRLADKFEDEKLLQLLQNREMSN